MDDIQGDQILAGLNSEQREAVTIEAPQLVIRAGAGSGKTRVLTRRIAYGAVTGEMDPRHVLALTFTRKAAGELNQRLRRLGLRESTAAGTFHSVALSQLRRRWDERGEAAPTLLDRKIGFVARLVPGLRDKTIPLDLVAEIEWAKARRIKPETYVAAAQDQGRTMALEPGRVAEIYSSYEETKSKRNLIDFDDILIWFGRILQTDEQAARAFRWSNRHLFVDEFQDVNPLQFALLREFAGTEPDLCVVGDSRQAIYAWNGADSAYLDNFSSFFPESKEVSLRQNYRSTPEILRCASAVLPTHESLTATVPSGPKPSLTNHADDRAEAKSIARALRKDRTQRTKWRDMAVLVRTNAQVTLLADALGAADVPVRARNSVKLLDRPEVMDAIEQMQRNGQGLAAGLDDLADRLASENQISEGDDSGEQAPSDPNSSERTMLLGALVRLGRDQLALDAGASIQSFVDGLKAGANEGANLNDDRVDVTTFHQAKGLEWEIVHVAGMEKGLCPIGHAKSDEALAEEERLIYVAITRAKRNLHLHWADERTFGDRVSNRSASPMLDPIRRANQGLDPRSKRSRNAAAAGALRKDVAARNGGPRLKPEADESDPVFTALKRWRLSTSKANDVPAYRIFDNKTLHEIARERPTDSDELLAITGIGPFKADTFGDDVLRIVAEAGAASD